MSFAHLAAPPVARRPAAAVGGRAVRDHREVLRAHGPHHREHGGVHPLHADDVVVAALGREGEGEFHNEGRQTACFLKDSKGGSWLNMSASRRKLLESQS